MNIVVLENTKHKDLHLKADNLYSHMVGQHIVPIVATEMPQVAINYPIVFIKQRDTGQFKISALLGFEPGENLIFTGNKVNANYIPINVRRYPFFIGTDQDNNPDNGFLCIDEDATCLSTEQGERLFDEENKPSEFLKQVTNLAQDLIQNEKATDKFVELLLEKELLQSSELTLRMGESGDKQVKGIYKINEEALYELSDEDILEFHKRRYFPAIYAHLGSLHQINRLLQIKSEIDSGSQN